MKFGPSTASGVDESFRFSKWCEPCSGGEVAACVEEKVGVAVIDLIALSHIKPFRISN